MSAGEESRLPEFSFGREARIGSHKRFEEVYKTSSKRVGHYLVAWAQKGTAKESRLGVVSTKKSFPYAVARNRVRRVMRESFRLLRPEFTDGPWDMVLLARRGADEVSATEIRKDLRILCEKFRILPRAEKPVGQVAREKGDV